MESDPSSRVSAAWLMLEMEPQRIPWDRSRDPHPFLSQPWEPDFAWILAAVVRPAGSALGCSGRLASRAETRGEGCLCVGTWRKMSQCLLPPSVPTIPGQPWTKSWGPREESDTGHCGNNL